MSNTSLDNSHQALGYTQDLEAERIQSGIYSRMSMAQKAKQLDDFWHTAKSLAAAGIAARHPNLDQSVKDQMVVRMMLFGRE